MNIPLGGLCIIVALLSVNISMCTNKLIEVLEEINKTLKNLKK